MKTDFGEISDSTAKIAAKSLLILAKKMKFMTKAMAIQKIKAQPFFGSALPKPTGETVKFRRPIPYQFEKKEMK